MAKPSLDGPIPRPSAPAISLYPAGARRKRRPAGRVRDDHTVRGAILEPSRIMQASVRSAISAWWAATMVRHMANGKPISVSRRRPTFRSVALPDSPRVNQLQKGPTRSVKSESIFAADRAVRTIPSERAESPKTRRRGMARLVGMGFNGAAAGGLAVQSETVRALDDGVDASSRRHRNVPRWSCCDAPPGGGGIQPPRPCLAIPLAGLLDRDLGRIQVESAPLGLPLVECDPLPSGRQQVRRRSGRTRPTSRCRRSSWSSARPTIREPCVLLPVRPPDSPGDAFLLCGEQLTAGQTIFDSARARYSPVSRCSPASSSSSIQD